MATTQRPKEPFRPKIRRNLYGDGGNFSLAWTQAFHAESAEMKGERAEFLFQKPDLRALRFLSALRVKRL